MSLKDVILGFEPTSYWPLDDVVGASCRDAMGLHDAMKSGEGVKLSVVPFGESRTAFFDGERGSCLTIDAHPQYSQPYANALTVAAWICPLSLDNTHTAGKADQFVHFMEKSVGPSQDVEWAMRLYNQSNPTRHSRLSFYTFNLGSPAGEGNGSYMEFGVSANDQTPIEVGKWVFVVGQAEAWISSDDLTTGCIFWKQGVEAKRTAPDKYGAYHVQPKDGSGSLKIGGNQITGYKGSLAHVAIWNRLLAPAEIMSIWTEGATELRNTPMYHSFV